MVDKLERLREAIQLYSNLENTLRKVEVSEGFREMVDRSEADIRVHRMYTQAEVRKLLLKKKR